MACDGFLSRLSVVSIAVVTSLILVVCAGSLYFFQDDNLALPIRLKLLDWYGPAQETGEAEVGEGRVEREGGTGGEEYHTNGSGTPPVASKTSEDVAGGGWSGAAGFEGGGDVRVKPLEIDDSRQTQVPGQDGINSTIYTQHLGQLPENETFKLFRTTDRSKLRNCTKCYGCSHKLLPIDASVTMLGRTFKPERGATSVWVFNIEDESTQKQEKYRPAVAKVWCVPALKAKQKTFRACNVEGGLAKAHSTLSIQKIVEDCGFDDIVTKAWAAPVNSNLPNTGYIIDWDGLWFEKAPGISLENLLKSPSQVAMKVMKRVNSSQVVQIALFELLTSQCDRHAQNVFIDEAGKLTLIDNDQALGVKWQPCGVDSLFLPTTEKYAINQVGHAYAYRREAGSKPISKPSPQLMLDYRCHVPGGKIGSDYPSKVHECLKKISAMTEEQAAQEYQLQEISSVKVLQNRAMSMLRRGFEWTLEFGAPLKPPQKQYQWYEPCCNFNAELQCLDKWHSDGRLPPFLL